jgi:hypothetical protein
VVGWRPRAALGEGFLLVFVVFIRTVGKVVSQFQVSDEAVLGSIDVVDRYAFVSRDESESLIQ